MCFVNTLSTITLTSISFIFYNKKSSGNVMGIHKFRANFYIFSAAQNKMCWHLYSEHSCYVSLTKTGYIQWILTRDLCTSFLFLCVIMKFLGCFITLEQCGLETVNPGAEHSCQTRTEVSRDNHAGDDVNTGLILSPIKWSDCILSEQFHYCGPGSHGTVDNPVMKDSITAWTPKELNPVNERLTKIHNLRI